MKTTSLSNHKLGFGIVALSIIALIVSFNENNFTLDDLETMEGKVTKVQLNKGGKYMNKIVSITAQLDNGRYFGLPARSAFGNPQEIAAKLTNANNVRVWLVKDYTSWEILTPQQLTIDDVMYIDFKDKHSSLPENFWLFCITLVVGVLFIFFERIVKSVVRKKN